MNTIEYRIPQFKMCNGYSIYNTLTHTVYIILYMYDNMMYYDVLYIIQCYSM